jgi:hypothetical protein
MIKGQLLFVTLVITLVTIGGLAEAQGDGGGGEDEGGLHCTLGALGLALVLGVITSGVLTSGRFGRIKWFKPYPVHMLGTIVMSIYMSGVYIYGTLISEHFTFPGNFHGQLGLLTVIFSWGTVGLSPCAIKKAIKRGVLSKVHLAMAVLLVTVIAAQIIYAYLVMGD